MSNDLLTKEQEGFKDLILKMERESLANINKTADSLMVAKIIKAYNEHQNDKKFKELAKK